MVYDLSRPSWLWQGTPLRAPTLFSINTSVLEDAPLSVGVETLPGIQTEADRGRLVT